MNDVFARTERTRVRRRPQRAAYDRESVYAILDAGLVCQIGFVEAGLPVVIPTAYARVGDAIVLHGSSRSRMLVGAGEGRDLCLTVALLDGLVLARSAFHHSVNYRSVVIFGRARPISDPQRKMEALRAFTERIYPGRWALVRPPSEQELAATAVLELPLEEVSAKVRSGGPIDDEEDYAIPVWAGVIPLAMTAGAPIADVRLHAGVVPPREGLFFTAECAEERRGETNGSAAGAAATQ
jgi:nitroimidazol reductase NimA-like FMN-containing flavoprotein (pyridoxamine 5'-phosphate oxidase superfamily)